MISGWQNVTLAQVLTQDTNYVTELEPKTYPKLSVKLYGRGVVLDSPTNGGSVRMKRHQFAKPGQVILSEIWAKKGAIGIVPPEGEGALVTSHFFLFYINEQLLAPGYITWLLKGNYFAEPLSSLARGTTGYAAVRPKHFLSLEIPLPPLEEQRRIVERIEALAARVCEAQQFRSEIKAGIKKMLQSAFSNVIANASYIPMSEVAPLIRRPVSIDTSKVYPELGVRSFGKGTFHKPALTGFEIGSKRLFEIKPGDLVFNNVFAWEGAVAVARPEDDGRFGSHRFITCVPQDGLARARFLCFFFFTNEGIEQLSAASPGGAGRNRTLGLSALSKINVPVPELKKQLWFESLLTTVDNISLLQNFSKKEFDALLPSILDKAFKGDL